MAATNLYPWVRNLDGATDPLVILGKVQAGATQAIKQGELVTWNETSGYFEPIDAAADIKYNLAFAGEEVSKLNTPQAGYRHIIVPRPADVFEIELAAAAAIEVGHNYEPTGTNSQTATLDADGDPVFNAVGQANYPGREKYAGTTIQSASHGLFTVNIAYSYYRQLVPPQGMFLKVLTVTAALTLKEEWSGMLVHNLGASGAVQVDLPQNCRIGTNFFFACAADQELRIHSAGGGIYVKGDKQADSKYVSVTDIGDFVHVVCLGANDWLAYSSISGADADITVES